jgi:hypothetical protein
MQTDEWGSHEWESMQFKAFGSPEKFSDEDKIKYETFFKVNASVLPCKMCQTAFGAMMTHIPIEEYLDGRDGLCYWIFIMHNLVNRKLEKKLEIFENVIFKYENFRARCGNKNNIIQYDECKKNLKSYTRKEAELKATQIRKIYNERALSHLENYYNSKDLLDPKICDL